MIFYARKAAALAILILAVASTPNAQPVRMWTPQMQLNVKGVGSVNVSPDGKKVVYTVSSYVVAAEKSESVTQIFLAGTNGGNISPITAGEKSAANPKWSPDGSMIAFTSAHNNRNNIFIWRLRGGEAEPLTNVKTGVADFQWSPDSAAIVFAATDARTEEEEKSAKERTDFRWFGENYKMRHLYLIPVGAAPDAKGEARRLTSGDFTVGDFDLAPDGSRIVFSHTKTPTANDWTTSDVSTVELATGSVAPLAASPAVESSPVFSPDGKSIAVYVSDDPPRWAQSGVIHVFPAAGGAPKALAPSFDRHPNIVGWSPDAKRIYFSEAKGTLTKIYAIDARNGKIETISRAEGVYAGVNLNASGTMFGFVFQKSDAPPEVYVSPVGDFAPVQISRANTDAELPPLGRTELIRWKSRDGREIEGLLTYPVGYQAGQRAPLLLNIHGGPAAVYQQNFIGGDSNFVYPIAAFAARGYAVLRPNPRGSFGYGAEFRYANIKDWGFGDYQDLMTGVDRAIEMGVADPNRLGVMGWSYGGYMTSWIVTQTKRFKAASAGASVSNLLSWHATADMPAFLADYLGGQPAEMLDAYRQISPVFNVKNVSTPTLLQHGENDNRVPISQAFEFYRALKAQNVPARVMILTRQAHSPFEPKMRLAAMQANLDWFEKYLGTSAVTEKNVSDDARQNKQSKGEQ